MLLPKQRQDRLILTSLRAACRRTLPRGQTLAVGGSLADATEAEELITATVSYRRRLAGHGAWALTTCTNTTYAIDPPAASMPCSAKNSRFRRYSGSVSPYRYMTSVPAGSGEHFSDPRP